MSIAHPLDQPTMQVNELDISPGFETQVAVTPTLYTTTDAAMKRFRPEQRGCYNQDELMLHNLPRRMYRFYKQLDNCFKVKLKNNRFKIFYVKVQHWKLPI